MITIISLEKATSLSQSERFRNVASVSRDELKFFRNVLASTIHFLEAALKAQTGFLTADPRSTGCKVRKITQLINEVGYMLVCMCVCNLYLNKFRIETAR